MVPVLPKLALAAILLGASFLAAQSQTVASGRRILAADDSTHRIAIIAPSGEVEWQSQAGPIHDASVLPDGNILFQRNWTDIVEVTPTGNIVWRYDAATANGNQGRHVEVHAIQRLEDGRTMLAESGSSRLIEVDGAGRLQREIRLKIAHPDAHMEVRLARKIANGNYLVAQQSDGLVREYAPDGTVVWDFEVPLFGKERKPGHGPEAFGNEVFSAVRLTNGNTLIGCGNGHSVLEVTPAKRIVWKVEQNDLPGITLAWVTRVSRLANGNTLIGNCHAGPANPQLMEVTPDKHVVWSFKDFQHFGNATTVAALVTGN